MAQAQEGGGQGNNFDVRFDPDEFFDDIDDDDTLSSDSIYYDGTDNWPLHADCKFDNSAGTGIWVLTPRSLKNLSALKAAQESNLTFLTPSEIPANLYPVLFAEACRLKAAQTVSLLVSTWPYPVLDLADVEIPLDCYRGYYTKPTSATKSLADMIIDGLLSLQQCSRLKRVVLPESEAEGAAITKAFVQLPVAVLQDIPHQQKIIWLRENFNQTCAETYMKSVCLPAFTAANFQRDWHQTVTISMPGIVQWVGRSSNYWDVLLGLGLQRHSPFLFHFDRISICNPEDLKVVRDILKLVLMPERVKKLVFHTSRLKNTIHVYCQLAALSAVLKAFAALESVISKLEGMYVHAFPQAFSSSQVVLTITDLFQSWKHLSELDLAGNMLLGKVGKMLTALDCPLRKLNLSACELSKSDLRLLAASHHAASLVYLNLDHNDLHHKRELVKTLLRALASVVTLRTCNCRLNYNDAVELASALTHSQTLKTWNLLQNNLGTLHELKGFVQHCSLIPGLKEVGCKPIEIHALFSGLYIHSTGPPPLSDDERGEIVELAERLQLLVF